MPPSEEGARVTDIWESAEDFQSFVDNRLMAGVRAAGIESDPEVDLIPVHAIFNPGVDRVLSASYENCRAGLRE